MEKAELLRRLNAIYTVVWGNDIKSPTHPETIWMHKVISEIMKEVLQLIADVENQV